MKALRMHRHGGPEVLQLEEAPDPAIGPSDALLEVKASSVNHLDLFLRNGMPGVKVPFPRILGSDASGIVKAVGSAVANVKPGQRVLVNPGMGCGTCEYCGEGHHSQCLSWKLIGENRDGAYAELLSVPAASVHPIPDWMTFEEAAAAPLTFQTSWSMLVPKAKVKPGETVLVLGAGAGVGVACVQIAKLCGARVIATASDDEKLKRLKELGADELINYKTAEFDSEVRKITNRRGVDVVVDYIGKETWVKSLKSLRRGGRLVTCGATTGFAPEEDLRHIFFRELTLYGSTMGGPKEFADVLANLFSRKLRPVIDSVFPLAKVGDAHRKMESRAFFGKLVITV